VRQRPLYRPAAAGRNPDRRVRRRLPLGGPLPAWCTAAVQPGDPDRRSAQPDRQCYSSWFAGGAVEGGPAPAGRPLEPECGGYGAGHDRCRTGEDRRTFLYHPGPGHRAGRVRGQIRDPGPWRRLSAAQSGGARHLGGTRAARAASCRGRAAGMTGPRILLVEDDRALREALADTLMLGGYDYLE